MRRSFRPWSPSVPRPLPWPGRDAGGDGGLSGRQSSEINAGAGPLPRHRRASGGRTVRPLGHTEPSLTHANEPEIAGRRSVWPSDLYSATARTAQCHKTDLSMKTTSDKGKNNNKVECTPPKCSCVSFLSFCFLFRNVYAQLNCRSRVFK